jgi:hypothetical protein
MNATDYSLLCTAASARLQYCSQCQSLHCTLLHCTALHCTGGHTVVYVTAVCMCTLFAAAPPPRQDCELPGCARHQVRDCPTAKNRLTVVYDPPPRRVFLCVRPVGWHVGCVSQTHRNTTCHHCNCCTLELGESLHSASGASTSTSSRTRAPTILS